jgi:putative tail protein
MAITAIGAAAAAVAGGIAGAAGATFATAMAIASVAFSVATLAANLLFPKKQPDQEGARLGDLAVQSSSFGQVRPICYGTVRLAGNIIWSLPIIEVKTTTHHGKGGGKGYNSTTYTYFATFALALCEGPVDAVIRIWADSKLRYDATAGSDTVRSDGFLFRFYPGNDSQMPDSIIEADKGVGNVPGYRGTCYLVFDRIPLIDYGNRIPNLTVELTMAAEPVYQYDPLVRAGSSIFGSVNLKGGNVDAERGVGYLAGSSPTGIIVYDIYTMQTIREVPMTEILTDGTDGGAYFGAYPFGWPSVNLLIGSTGDLYFVTDTHLVRVDQNTMRQTAGYDLSLLGFFFQQLLVMGSYYDIYGARIDTVVLVDTFGELAAFTSPELLPVSVTGALQARPGGVVAGVAQVGTGDIWAATGTGTGSAVHIDRIVVSNAGVAVSPVLDVAATDLDPSDLYVMPSAYALVYDTTDNTLIFPCQANQAWLVKVSLTGIVWKTLLPAGPAANNYGANRISSGTFGLGLTGYFIEVSTATGEIIYQATTTGSEWPFGLVNTFQQYESSTQTLLAAFNTGSSPGVAKAYLGRMTGGPTTLGDIIADQCRRAGFADGDFDVSAITNEIKGYTISQRATVLDTLASLLAVFFVDAIETDYVLRFIQRGGTSVASLVEDDLIRIASSETSAEAYTEVRQQEIELPMVVTLSYVDQDRDYQINTQTSRRITHPDPTVYSDNQADLSLAIVTTATPAKQLTEVILFNAWNERHTFNVRLAPRYSYLDPSDVIQFTVASDSFTTRARLGTTALGLDRSLDTKLICETEGQYVSTATADAGVPWGPSHTMVSLAPSALLMLDTPLLRDIDDTGGRAIRGYWGAGNYTTASWPGATLQQSDALDIWTSLSGTTHEATLGFVVTPPEDTVATFATQYDGSITVTVLGGDFVPSSTTDLGMANGVNPMVLVKANGEVEIIQYRDVTTVSATTYILSVLRRGQRGTDTMATGHTAGERFVFLDDVTVSGLLIDLAVRNISEFYRAPTNGTAAQAAATLPFTFHARDQMPYAPVDFRSSISGSPADLVVTWKRRSRIGGAMTDGIDTVPVNETSEAYEAYVIASDAAFDTFDPIDAGTYVRAFSGMTTATLTYTAAQMSTDSFDPATDTLYLVVYQLSGTVGRGFAGFEAVPAF